jgi:hypothetical protein
MNEEPEETRPPTIDDLVALCRELNARGAHYIVIGGLAMMEQGMPRFTDDIDLLYETSRVNQRKLREVLALLPDRAILEIDEAEDMAGLGTVRVNDIITIDLMPSACGVDYAQAKSMVEWREAGGVKVPFANAELLLETKRSLREKDQIDSAFLRKKIGERKKE